MLNMLTKDILNIKFELLGMKTVVSEIKTILDGSTADETLQNKCEDMSRETTQNET